MSSVLLIDNYDSFVFNLERYVQELGLETDVVRNDAVSVAEVTARAPRAIILSPGPGTPQQAGICEQLVQQLGDTVPILGVCLGHQAIASALGGRVVRSSKPVHGRTALIQHNCSGLFEGCLTPLRVARYHSLSVDSETLPPCLQVTATTEDGIIMGMQHTRWPVFGVQFHPESILTQCGHQLLANFLRYAGFEDLSTTTCGEMEVNQGAADDFYQRLIGSDALRPF